MALSINQGTQTPVYTQALGGGTEVGVVRLDRGTGATAEPWGGTVLALGNLEKGTITKLEGGTLAEVTAVTTVSNLTNGTVRISAGTVVGGTLGNLDSGTILALASGTVTGGTLQNLVSGTVNALASGTITGGTLQNLVSGTVNALAAGTITGGTLGNLVSGTINALASGTITNGTVLTIGQRHADEFATVVSSGTSVLGTIKAAVAGSAIYVTGLVISVQAPSNVEIASGGTSTPIAGTYFFAGSGGAVIMPINPPLRTASGSALVYKQSANTGLSITAVGYVD